MYKLDLNSLCNTAALPHQNRNEIYINKTQIYNYFGAFSYIDLQTEKQGIKTSTNGQKS